MSSFAVCVIHFLTFCLPAALEDAIEALSSGASVELPLVRPKLTLLQDYSQPLERYEDYEDDEGELRAESNLAEKFGEFAFLTINHSLLLTGNCIWLSECGSWEVNVSGTHLLQHVEQTSCWGLITVLHADRLVVVLLHHSSFGKNAEALLNERGRDLKQDVKGLIDNI